MHALPHAQLPSPHNEAGTPSPLAPIPTDTAAPSIRYQNGSASSSSTLHSQKNRYQTHHDHCHFLSPWMEVLQRDPQWLHESLAAFFAAPPPNKVLQSRFFAPLAEFWNPVNATYKLFKLLPPPSFLPSSSLPNKQSAIAA